MGKELERLKEIITPLKQTNKRVKQMKKEAYTRMTRADLPILKQMPPETIELSPVQAYPFCLPVSPSPRITATQIYDLHEAKNLSYAAAPT